MAWKPIKSAPKDGTWIMLSVVRDMGKDWKPGRYSRLDMPVIAHWKKPTPSQYTIDAGDKIITVERKKSKWCFVGNNWDTPISDKRMIPTHWMNLPKHPTTPEAS